MSQADAAVDPRQAPSVSVSASASASAKASTSTGANAMLGLLWIVTCPLIGEALALWTGLPVPGAVMGVFVMFLCLRAIGRVSECIDVAGAALRRNLPLFVMPAGVSVMAHLGMLQADLVAIVDARQLAVHSAAGTSLAGRFSALPALAADGVPR